MSEDSQRSLMITDAQTIIYTDDTPEIVCSESFMRHYVIVCAAKVQVGPQTRKISKSLISMYCRISGQSDLCLCSCKKVV